MAFSENRTGGAVMAREKQPKPVHQMTAAQFDNLFKSEDDCAAYLVARRWPEGPRCPRCGNPAVYDLPSRKWHWQCEKCAPDGYRFSHLVGTIFENTNKPLKDWFRVIHLMLTSKKGMSALQIMRYLGFGSYKTAWLMCHKVRTALDEKDVGKLGGIVEVDETFVGGDSNNKHWDKRPGRGKGKRDNKTIVIGAVRRKGNVVARVIQNVQGSTLTAFVNEAVSNKVSLLCTDEAPGYSRLSEEGYPHKTVDHRAREYVVGAVHTQTIEGFWSLIKRGVVGTYHKVSKKYLHLYVAEFQFRYNNRQNPDIFGTAIKGC
jgi:transposase-like protein